MHDLSTSQQLQYAGFWIRTGASIVDTILLLLVTYPILFVIYGPSYFDLNYEGAFVRGGADFIISYVLPAVVVIAFWVAKQATPGKMAVSCKILDARTGNPPSGGQCVIRYLGYIVAMLPLGLGILWVAVDRRKQGLHDKIAGTVVVRQRQPEEVRFDPA